MQQFKFIFIATFIIIAIIVCKPGIISIGKCRTSNSPDKFQEQLKQDIGFNFKEVSSKKGVTSEGTPFSSQLYESSDGVELTLTRENHASRVKVKAEMQKKLQRASKIIERGAKLDSSGRQLGERVVAVILASNSSEGKALILWTSGRQLYYVESLSTQHAKEFEKKFIN